MKTKDTPFRRIFDWCIVLCILGFTIVQLFSYFSFGTKYLEYMDYSDKENECSNAVFTYLETINTLSTDMCQYAFTGDEYYINDYFSILNGSGFKNTVSTLEETGSAFDFNDFVSKEADCVFGLEMRVLKMAAIANGFPESKMDEQLKNWELSGDDLMLSQDQLSQKASELAFSDDYREAKTRFGVALNEFSQNLKTKNELFGNEYSELIKAKTKVQQTMLLLTAALMLLIVILLYKQMVTINKMLVDEQQYKGALITDSIGVFEVNLTEDRIESILSEKNDTLSNELKRLKLTVPCPFSEFLSAVMPSVPPADASSMERFSSAYFINQFNNDNRFITREHWYSPSDERHIYLRNTIILSKRPDSESVFALIVFRDVTAEKLEYEKQHQLVELSLRSGQQYLEALRTDSVGIYETNITTGILEHIISDSPDHKIARLFEDLGLTLPCKISKYRDALLPLIDEEQRKNLIPLDSGLLSELYAKGVRNQICELWVNMPDGTRVYFKNTMLLRREEGTGDLVSIVIIKDYTKQQLEKEDRQLELLQQKARNEEKNRFFSSMSHDIRTPLNGVIGMLDLVRHHMDEPDRVRDYIEKIDHSSKHLLSLVNDVLDMSAIDSGKVEIARKPVNIQTLLEDCFVILKNQLLNRDIMLNVDYGTLKTPVVMSDAVALKKIIMNILGNAVKFTNDGGEISFKSEYSYSFDGTTLNAKFVMADTGIGMSEEFVKKLFEPFSQENSGARTNYQGTGLGMAIVKQYVDVLKGTISVESTKGKGTAFTVELPFELSKDDVVVTAEPDLIDVQGLNILLVDDNELNIEIVQMLLEDQGAVVTTASNGCEAVDAFTASEDGHFDAIIMDIMMPIMGGIEATKSIRRMVMNRKDAADIPIIALTANAFVSDIEKTEEAGMTAHLSKPIVPHMLMETLTRCCRG